jgi:hypothetical protein
MAHQIITHTAYSSRGARPAENSAAIMHLEPGMISPQIFSRIQTFHQLFPPYAGRPVKVIARQSSIVLFLFFDQPIGEADLSPYCDQIIQILSSHFKVHPSDLPVLGLSLTNTVEGLSAYRQLEAVLEFRHFYHSDWRASQPFPAEKELLAIMTFLASDDFLSRVASLSLEIVTYLSVSLSLSLSLLIFSLTVGALPCICESPLGGRCYFVSTVERPASRRVEDRPEIVTKGRSFFPPSCSQPNWRSTVSEGGSNLF